MLRRALALCVVAATAAAAQNASPLVAKYGKNIGGTIHAELEKRIDLKKMKVGDAVTAKLSKDLRVGGDLLAKKHAKVTGHVVEEMDKTKGEPANRLAIVFEQVQMPDGGELPIYGAITGVFGETAGGDSVAELQAARMEHMRGEMTGGGETAETAQTVNELAVTATTGQQTVASQNFNCSADSSGSLWCAPKGNTVLRAVRAEGVKDLEIQLEKTPHGPLGVFVSRGDIQVNSGVDLAVQLFPHQQ